MVAERELEQVLERREHALEIQQNSRLGAAFHAPTRVSMGPAPTSPALLVGLAIAGLVLWAYVRSLAEEDREDLRDLQAARAEVEELGTISWEEIKRKHGL